MNFLSSVVPAYAGTQALAEHREGPWRNSSTSLLDSRMRGNDDRDKHPDLETHPCVKDTTR